MRLIPSLFASLTLALTIFSTAVHAEMAEMAEAHSGKGIQAHHAWVRAVPPSSKMSAAYMVLHNNGAMDDHLVSAESSVAKSVELHNVRKTDGMMEMYQVKSIGIPAEGERELKPGSYHVMLIGLTQPLKAGDEVELTLNFMNAGAVTLKVPVKEGAPMPHMMHH